MIKNCVCSFFRRSYSQNALPVPVIKIPKYVKKHVEKIQTVELRRQQLLRRKIIFRGNTSIPVISSNEGEYNHYLGQLYSDRYPLPLLSKYWFKAKSSGQKFTIHSYDNNSSLPILNDDFNSDIDCIKEFSKLSLNANVCESLIKDFNFLAPTPIQSLTIPIILDRKHVLLAAETGCGKTVAYLAPIISHISYLKKKISRFPNAPLGLIITPGRELAEQVADVAYKLSYRSGVDVKILVPEGTYKSHLKPLPYSNIDILVATIGCLSKLQNRVFKLSNLEHLVLDEADTLTDDSFIEDLSHILQKLHIREKCRDQVQGGTQMTFVSSIYPSSISELFSDVIPESDICKICSNYLHRVLAHVEQRFWRVNNNSRAGDLLQIVKSSYQKKEPTLIFCNKSPTCDWMSEYFKDNGVPNGKMHGGMHVIERSKIFNAFQSGMINVLCCTDLVSRGLDTQRVKHVINFDFPNSTSDYILRCGRVGRVGTNHGRVTNLIVSKSGVHTVQEIESAIRNFTRIQDVDSNIKKKLKKLYYLQ